MTHSPKEVPEGHPSQQETGASLNWLMAIMPVVLIAACAELGTAILNNSVLPVYFTIALDIPKNIFPLLLLPFFVSEVFFKPVFGALADRYGRKYFLFWGAAITVVTPLIMTQVSYSPGMVLPLLIFGLLRFLDGVGGAAIWPVLYAYVGDVVEEKKRGVAMSVLNVVYMIGLSLAFWAGGRVDDHFGPMLTGKDPVTSLQYPQHYYPSFYLASALFAVSALIALIGVRKKNTALVEGQPAEEDHKITWAGFLATLKSVPHFLILAFITFLGMGCIAPFAKVYALETFHITEADFGKLILWPALIIGALAIPAGHLSDRWGKTYCVRLGFILCTLGLWGIPVLHYMGYHSVPGFVISATVMGLGFMLAFPAWTALLTMIGGDRERGAVLGAVSTAQAIGMVAGAVLGGLLAKTADIAPFVAAAAFVGVGMVLSLIFVRESSVKERSFSS